MLAFAQILRADTRHVPRVQPRYLPQSLSGTGAFERKEFVFKLLVEAGGHNGDWRYAPNS